MYIVLNNSNYFEYQTNKSLRFLIQWNIAQIATNTHSSVTATIQTTSLRSSDGVLWRCLNSSLQFAFVLVLADELLVFKDRLIIEHFCIKLSFVF